MHIPDGILDTPVWAAMNLVSWPAVGWMARRAKLDVDEARLPLLGVMGAFVFAAQMVNFPVGVGTSGHLLGGALLAVTLGPAAASIVMTAILAVQALVFQDGGILALGANVFNMAILGVVAGYLPYHFWGGTTWRRAAIFVGGVLSVLTGGCLALGQILLSGAPMPPSVVSLSLALFMVTAAIEGAITLAVFEAIERLNPRWVAAPVGQQRVGGALAAAAVLLGLVGALFASASPDVLDSFLQQVGVASRASTTLTSPLSDYEWQGASTPWLRKASAGVFGLLLIYAVCLISARLLRRRTVTS
jgi:cobalt/nickel transport system permease protein